MPLIFKIITTIKKKSKMRKGGTGLYRPISLDFYKVFKVFTMSNCSQKKIYMKEKTKKKGSGGLNRFETLEPLKPSKPSMSPLAATRNEKDKGKFKKLHSLLSTFQAPTILPFFSA